MRKLLAIFAVMVAAFLLGSLWIAPPHFFIIGAPSQNPSATLQVVDGKTSHMFSLFGGLLFVGKVNVTEGAAIIRVAGRDGRETVCNISYFSFEFEPHYYSIKDCDGKTWL